MQTTTLAVGHLALAPLGAGDLIDRTVRLYRRHFLTLIRTSAPPVVVSAFGSVLWAIGVREISVTESSQFLFIYFALTIVGLALLMGGTLLNFIVMGGATRNLVAHLLWGEAVSARAIYRSVRSRFWGLLGATVAVSIYVAIMSGVAFFAWYMVLAIAIIGAVVIAQVAPAWLSGVIGIGVFIAGTVGVLWLFFFLVGRVAYVPQVMMVEGQGVFAAIGRSVTLARGNVRRLGALFLFTTFATYSALMLLLIPLGWYGYLRGIDLFSLSAANWPMWYAIAYQVVVQLSYILLAPVWMLGLSLLYVDERVRHEGYDIELMAAQRLGEIPMLPDGRAAPFAPALAAGPVSLAPPPARGIHLYAPIPGLTEKSTK